MSLKSVAEHFTNVKYKLVKKTSFDHSKLLSRQFAKRHNHALYVKNSCLHLNKVSLRIVGLVAKSNAQNDLGNGTSMCWRTSTGGLETIGVGHPKNGYEYLK